MEMETLMKRPEVALEDAKDADEWKTRVINMLETGLLASSRSHQQMLVVLTCILWIYK